MVMLRRGDRGRDTGLVDGRDRGYGYWRRGGEARTMAAVCGPLGRRAEGMKRARTISRGMLFEAERWARSAWV